MLENLLGKWGDLQKKTVLHPNFTFNYDISAGNLLINLRFGVRMFFEEPSLASLERVLIQQC